jgi:prolipoprotein diacylglyceryl transferase
VIGAAGSAPAGGLAYLPSPSQGVWWLGPFPIRAYALCILVGIVLAVWLGDRRWRERGGQPGLVLDLAAWAVPFGIVGGRLYHVATSWQKYFGSGGDPVRALYIWEGGLGIWGAVALGALGAWIAVRRRGYRLPPMADALAPGIVLAQGIGRWGNWFNNELYGSQTTLPWGLKVHQWDAVAGNAALGADGLPIVLAGAFHPTFLYESLWDIGTALVLIWADRRFKLGHGRVFALYGILYTVGRFWIEALRVDEANSILGLRLNLWTSALVFVVSLAGFMISLRRHPGRETTLRRTATSVDATTVDATTVDATTVDATTVDATTVDATTVDATTADATTADATTVDARAAGVAAPAADAVAAGATLLPTDPPDPAPTMDSAPGSTAVAAADRVESALVAQRPSAGAEVGAAATAAAVAGAALAAAADRVDVPADVEPAVAAVERVATEPVAGPASAVTPTIEPPTAVPSTLDTPTVPKAPSEAQDRRATVSLPRAATLPEPVAGPQTEATQEEPDTRGEAEPAAESVAPGQVAPLEPEPAVRSGTEPESLEPAAAEPDAAAQVAAEVALRAEAARDPAAVVEPQPEPASVALAGRTEGPQAQAPELEPAAEPRLTAEPDVVPVAEPDVVPVAEPDVVPVADLETVPAEPEVVAEPRADPEVVAEPPADPEVVAEPPAEPEVVAEPPAEPEVVAEPPADPEVVVEPEVVEPEVQPEAGGAPIDSVDPDSSGADDEDPASGEASAVRTGPSRPSVATGVADHLAAGRTSTDATDVVDAAVSQAEGTLESVEIPSTGVVTSEVD